MKRNERITERNCRRIRRSDGLRMKTVKGYTFPDFMDSISSRYSKRTCYRVFRTGEENDLTYSQLVWNAQAAASYLLSLGVGKGDRIAIIGESCPEWMTMYLAIVSIGAIAVPILPDFSSRDMHQILSDSGARGCAVNAKHWPKVSDIGGLLFRLDDKTLKLKSIMHPAVYFYENMSVYKALEQMKEKRLTQAFICDEFGSFQGIITLRDILEGLVGTINEVNNDPEIVKREDSESWLVDGQCSFYDFLSYFDKEDLYDSEQQDYNTLAGLIIEQMKHIPQAGERTDWNCFNFEIVDMDGARIDKVLVTMKDTEGTEDK